MNKIECNGCSVFEYRKTSCKKCLKICPQDKSLMEEIYKTTTEYLVIHYLCKICGQINRIHAIHKFRVRNLITEKIGISKLGSTRDFKISYTDGGNIEG